MKIKMSMKILTIIDYIQSQRRALAILHNEIKPDKVNYIKELEEIYNQLPLPQGMNTSIACFEAVLHYPLTDEIMSTRAEELQDKFEFGY